VTVSIKRMSAGDGYRYLMRSVAVGDAGREASTPLTRYYAQSGNPPGRWMGSGLAGLDDGRGLELGSTASERQMFHLFGMGNDPVSGEQLGARPYRFDAATARGSVAGFDLTFSVPKSVSAWWAVADGHIQQAIVQAHEAALAACIGLLETDVAATRIGKNGVAQADVRGLVAAGFDHWDSRAGDPHLHTHVVIANRVQARDGQWRTLDSRALYRSVVAASEAYHGLLADELSRSLGVAWDQRTRRHSAVPAWEIADVPDELIAVFSQRSHAIEAEKNRLVAEFRDRHGRDPSAVEVLKLRQHATLSTRPDKQLHSLAELSEQWRERASAVLGVDAQVWAKGVGAEASNAMRSVSDLSDERLSVLAVTVRSAVQAKRSTWNYWNLYAEASRQLMGHRFATAADRLRATSRLAAGATNASVLLTPPELALTPPSLRRADGTSRFAHRHSEKYTSRTLLDAEARLLDAGRSWLGPRVDIAVVEQTLAVPPPRHRYLLGADQSAAVREITGSGRVVDVLVGPAGTGKTVTLAGLRAAWEAGHGQGSVIGLAPSAAAADVLASELGIATENTAKWLAEADQEPARVQVIGRHRAAIVRLGGRNPRLAAALRQRLTGISAQVEKWRLHPEQLVVIDEASLAGTLTLDRITGQARDAGAKVLLIGDWAQLSAIGAAGAFALLVADRDHPPELGAIRRFTARWERTASARLRTGDSSVLDDYQTHGRLHDGDTAAMLDTAYRAWRADERAGRRSLLLAADADTVTELNTRAHADLVAAGRVHPDGTQLTAGTIAGVGDRIVTRRNDRALSTGRGFVKNGDQWIVTERGPAGGLTVQRPGGGPHLTLSADYVAEHVDLAYATTAYRAQGTTVDTAHAVIIGPGMTREALYVAMTRGRHRNSVYVATDAAGEHCDRLPTERAATGLDVLTAILGRSGADSAAHTIMRAEQDAASSIRQLADEYDTIAATAQSHRWRRALATGGLSSDQVRGVETSPAYGPLAVALRRADADGLPVERTLGDLITGRSLAGAEDIAAVLHERVTRWAATTRPPRGQGAGMIAGLIPIAAGIIELDAHDALRQRAELIEHRAQALVERALAQHEPWIRRLGTPPHTPYDRAAWLRAARTVAAYRDRYTDPSSQPGGAAEASREDRAVADRALRDAIALSHRSKQQRRPTPTPTNQRPRRL
jgi:conjugative relaxase-like TrwC/TraI family protein